MEYRGHSRHLFWLLESIPTIYYRYDNTLVTCALETLVSHQFRTTAPTRNGYNRRSSSIHSLSIHHCRLTGIYLFSVLIFENNQISPNYEKFKSC